MNKKEKTEKLFKTARKFIGRPYKYGAEIKKNDKTTPLDCSLFTQMVFKEIGIELPRSSILQATKGKEIFVKKDLRSGDLLFFEGERGHYRHDIFRNKKLYIGHVGIYTGNMNIIHATNNYKFSGVVEHSLYEKSPCNIKTIILIKRII